MASIATRIAEAGDKPAIWALFQSAMKHHIEAIWGWDEAWQVANLDAAFSTSVIYVVETDGAFCGYYQLDIRPDETYLRMFVLASEVRFKGVGAQLLAEVHRRSLQAGRGLGLRVFRVNSDAKRFYEREGWHVAAEEDISFLMSHPINPPKRCLPYELSATEFEISFKA